VRRSLGFDPCTYCGRYERLTHDHVIPRSLIPGALRDHPDNLVPACYPCNVGRKHGYHPLWRSLPPATQAFVLGHKGPVFAERYFREFSEPAKEGATT
jgi:hypothetical protein